ncbi:MAG: D-alanyl-D-alanine carboxypeptidase [Verrucomicrobia bacterium]|nr:D-alanyl-D-alanine carboxypeptidase [Verrucomicrobiota bacterium]
MLFRRLFAAASLCCLPLALPAAEAYIVADATTGQVLDAREPRAKRQVASLTKVASAILVLDWCELRKINLGELVTIPPQSVVPNMNNPIGWAAGDRASVRDLLFCSLLQSDNIAADALAWHFGAQLPGDAGATAQQRFVQQMNALAKSLRMDRTLFLNASGIDAQESPYSTAQDMARLTKHALSKAGFRFFVAQKERRISIQRADRVPVAVALPAGTPGAPTAPRGPVNEPALGGPGAAAPTPVAAPSEYLLRNTNEILGKDEIDGVKTGQTAKAGSCLIVSATKPPLTKKVGDEVQVTPRKLIVVVLGSPDRFGEARALLQKGWALYDQWTAQGRPPGEPKNNL